MERKNYIAPATEVVGLAVECMEEIILSASGETNTPAEAKRHFIQVENVWEEDDEEEPIFHYRYRFSLWDD